MKKQKSREPVAALLFLGYCALMIYLLLFMDRAATEGLSYWEQVQNNCNFIPGRTVGNYWDVLTRPDYYMKKWETASVYYYQASIALVNILGNIAMFVPFGVFLPVMWRCLQRAWKAIPVGMLTIALVEIIQLLTLRGRCDIDDVLLNVIGIAAGYGLWRFVKFCCSRKK